LEHNPPDSWFFSQLWVGSEVPPPFERQAFEHYYLNAYDANCKCWRTIDDGQQVAATAWVLLAYAASHRRVQPDVVASLLAKQSVDGWWPAFFNADASDANASSYATALVVLALHEYRFSSATGDGDKQAKLDQAILRAGNWLFSHSPAKGQLWSDYPNLKDQMINSRGVSALVTSVFLTVFKDGRAKPMFLEWFASLEAPLRLDNLEAAVTFSSLKNGTYHRDWTRYLVFA
jgi:hypothetical protein